MLAFCQQGMVFEAIATVLQLDGWLREQDWAQLRPEHVSVDRGGRMALLLGDRLIIKNFRLGLATGTADLPSWGPVTPDSESSWA